MLFSILLVLMTQASRYRQEKGKQWPDLLDWNKSWGHFLGTAKMLLCCGEWHKHTKDFLECLHKFIVNQWMVYINSLHPILLALWSGICHLWKSGRISATLFLNCCSLFSFSLSSFSSAGNCFQTLNTVCIILLYQITEGKTNSRYQNWKVECNACKNHVWISTFFLPCSHILCKKKSFMIPVEAKLTIKWRGLRCPTATTQAVKMHYVPY